MIGALAYLPAAWFAGRWALRGAAARGWLAHPSRAALPIWLGVLLAGAWLAEVVGSLTLRDAARVGVGMVPRGEITLIVAGSGLGAGMVSRETFSALVALALLTTVATPLALRLTTGRHAKRPA